MTKFPMNCLVPPLSLLLMFIIPDHPLWKPSCALMTTVATTPFMPAVKPTAGFRCRAVTQLGNSANLGISVGGNIGKGRGDDESHTHRHIHIGDKGSQTVIRSGDASLRGAQVIGKGIRADSRNLNIESVQDTAAYHGKQQNGSLQITAANTEINQHLDGLRNNWKKVKSAKRNMTAKLPTGSADKCYSTA